MYLIISNKIITTPIKESNSEIIGNIIIEKIDLNMPLYNVKSPNNNIEKNIEILKESILPPNKNSIIFLAAHSGTSNISYFIITSYHRIQLSIPGHGCQILTVLT